MIGADLQPACIFGGIRCSRGGAPGYVEKGLRPLLETSMRQPSMNTASADRGEYATTTWGDAPGYDEKGLRPLLETSMRQPSMNTAPGGG